VDIFDVETSQTRGNFEADPQPLRKYQQYRAFNRWSGRRVEFEYHPAGSSEIRVKHASGVVSWHPKKEFCRNYVMRRSTSAKVLRWQHSYKRGHYLEATGQLMDTWESGVCVTRRAQFRYVKSGITVWYTEEQLRAFCIGCVDFKYQEQEILL
jgi:hypothetical protein